MEKLKSQQLEENRKWYEERGIDVDELIKQTKIIELTNPNERGL